ncbi:MAG TPA: alpha-amylase family glycosyl hydrolase [Thermoanaerobaculia bacterium]|jgi:glycosidase
MNAIARRSLRLAPLPLLFTLALAASNAPAEARPATAPAAVQWQHDWARGAVFYEVFVRSFADSDGDGVGDLRGLTAKLDYLKDLGVDALWLMPVFESPSYHGYDTIDYEKIQPAYGTGEDFDRFLAEAHKRGIKVILDFVMNHTSSKNPWFIDSASSFSAPHRDWYVWRTDDPGWKQPWGDGPTWHPNPNGPTPIPTFYYGIFWGGMPDLNFSTPAVRQQMEHLAGAWLARGVDGFRLDATRHLFANGPGDLQNDQPETHDYLREFAAAVRQAKPQATLVGENWTETPKIATYYGSTAVIKEGDELPMTFNFPLAEAIVKAVHDGDASGIAAKLQEMAAVYPAGIIDTPFLTNHDQQRVATDLGNDPTKLRSAAAVLLTLPGAPFLYYGEEVGLQNGPGAKDELKRTPMPWDETTGGGFTTGHPWFDFAPGRETANVAVEAGDPSSLLSYYRQLIRLRHSSAALKKGDLKLLAPGGPVLAFLRQSGKERVLVVHNLGAGEVAAGPYAIGGRRLDLLFGPTAKPVKGAEGWTVTVPAGASGVWRVR